MSDTNEPQVTYARRLGVWDATMVVIGGVIGSGIFLSPAAIARQTGSATEQLLAWAIGGALALIGALCYAELGARRPNAGGGSSTQAESSGMGVYAHELTHLLSIGDNYNNPYGVPLRRAYTGIWSMMSRSSCRAVSAPPGIVSSRSS